jgi:hypothetical protein
MKGAVVANFEVATMHDIREVAEKERNISGPTKYFQMHFNEYLPIIRH